MKILQRDRRLPARASARSSVLLTALCLLLLALLAFVQVAHVHPLESAADHCPLCVVLHAVAPVHVAAAIIILVQLGTPFAAAESRTSVFLWHPSLFIRPPPAGF